MDPDKLCYRTSSYSYMADVLLSCMVACVVWKYSGLRFVYSNEGNNN
jgi:hypothetical protein